MSRVVPHAYYDWAVIDDAGVLIGYLDHQGNPISTTPGLGDVTLIGAQTLLNKTLASPVITGTVTGLTKASVGLANVNNTADADKPVSDATQLALNVKVPTSTTVNGQPLTGNVTVVGAAGPTGPTGPTGPAGASGAGAPVPIDVAFNAAYPFDTVGFGKRTASYTPAGAVSVTLGAGPVEGGAYEIVYQMGATGYAVTFPVSWIKRGTDVFGITANKRTKFIGQYTAGTVIYALIPLADAVAVPAFTAQAAPGATVGTAYSYTFVATGAVSYALASGALPAGITLNTSTGIISGTPTTAATASFTISATNTGGTTTSSAQVIVVSAAASSLFDELWPGVNGAALPAGWTVVTGSPTQLGAGSAGWSGSSGRVLRDVATQNYTITANCKPDGNYPTIILRSDSTQTNYVAVMFHAAAARVKVFEHNAGADTNIVAGTTVIDITGATNYSLVITVSGTSVTVAVNGAAIEISATLAQGSTGTYVGLQQTNAGFASFGRMQAA